MVVYLWYTLAVCIFGFNLTLCCLECLSWSQDAWAQSLAPNCQFSHHQSCLSIFFTFVYSFNDICLLCFRTSTWPSLHSWAILNWSHYPNFSIFKMIIGEHLCNIFWTPILAIQSFLGASTSWPPLSFLPSNETGSQPEFFSGWKFTNKLKTVTETVIWMWPIWKHGLEKEARWIEEPPANSQPHHGRQHTHHHLHNINIIIIIIFFIIIIATS